MEKSTNLDKQFIGPGGAPMRATTLPTDAQERKQFPVASGLMDYFPDALAAVAHVSWSGNEQHNPGQSLRWDRAKSKDEADTMLRHFLERGMLDKDGIRHSAKMAWRALALLQKEIEGEQSQEGPLQTLESYVYLAGPMRGYAQCNFPAFFHAAKVLRARGFSVWSPAEHDIEKDGFDPTIANTTKQPLTLSHYMARDLPAICNSGGIVVLPGWEKSEGCRLELTVALALSKPVWTQDMVPIHDDEVRTRLAL